MKPTTKLHGRANNVGKPNQDLTIDGMPMLEALKTLAKWLLTQEMGKRIDVCFGRNAEDVQIVMLDARVRKQTGYDKTLDDMFDESMFESPTQPTSDLSHVVTADSEIYMGDGNTRDWNN